MNTIAEETRANLRDLIPDGSLCKECANLEQFGCIGGIKSYRTVYGYRVVTQCTNFKKKDCT